MKNAGQYNAAYAASLRNSAATRPLVEYDMYFAHLFAAAHAHVSPPQFALVACNISTFSPWRDLFLAAQRVLYPPKVVQQTLPVAEAPMLGHVFTFSEIED